MKNSTTLIFAVLAITGGVTAAWAERGGKQMPSFENLDVDGSGEITVEDLEAMRDARFAELDSNGDGMISEDEFLEAAKSERAERAAKKFARMDANDDGMLAADELGARRGGGAKMIEKLDEDGSGGVSAEEFEKMKKKRGKGKRGDKNSDNDDS